MDEITSLRRALEEVTKERNSLRCALEDSKKSYQQKRDESAQMSGLWVIERHKNRVLLEELEALKKDKS